MEDNYKVYGFKLPTSTDDKLDQMAIQSGLTRSKIITQLVDLAQEINVDFKINIKMNGEKGNE